MFPLCILEVWQARKIHCSDNVLPPQIREIMSLKSALPLQLAIKFTIVTTILNWAPLKCLETFRNCSISFLSQVMDASKRYTVIFRPLSKEALQISYFSFSTNNHRKSSQ